MGIVLSICLGSIFGALSRYYIAVFINSYNQNFPYSTLFINVLGSFLIGILFQLFSSKIQVTEELKAFLFIGLLGSFTTFSTFSLDTLLLIKNGQFINALAYILASVLISIGGIFLGTFIIKNI